MAHDSRCGDATTPTGYCDCDCDGRLHGIGNGNNNHQTQTITEEEKRINEEFDKHFKPDDGRRLRDNADFEAWEQLTEEKPELAKKLQDAEDNPDLDFEVGDIFWEKSADGDRMTVLAPGIDDNDALDQETKDELTDAAYEYMLRKKANQYSTKEDMLRELNEVSTEEGAFPELEYIDSSLDKSKAEEEPYEPSREIYTGEHRFGDLEIKRRYFINDPAKEEEVDTADEPKTLIVETNQFAHGERIPGAIGAIGPSEEYEIEDGKIGSETVEEFVKANHYVDPQAEFGEFGRST